MSKNTEKHKKIGKQEVKVDKGLWSHKRFRGTIYTIIFIIIMIIYFIINNTVSEPEKGSYPPDYNKDSVQKYLDKN